MSKICLIGNSGIKNKVFDGQTEKVKLYIKKICDEGNEIFFVDLESFFKNPFGILRKIKKGIKICDRIVLLAAERGCMVLIPYINLINRKYKKPFILPLIGIGVLHHLLRNLSEEEKISFFIHKKYGLAKRDKRLSSKLSKITAILPETSLLADAYVEIFKLNNVVVLNNFRDIEPVLNTPFHKDDKLHIIYASRVMSIKGIFDLVKVVNEINQDAPKISLDIFGINNLNKEENKKFMSSLNEHVTYGGQIDNDKLVKIISNYDLFAFPTKYIGEGTPGVISESLLASTPVLSSTFPQADFLLKDKYDAIFFEINNENDLKEKINWIINNKPLLYKMRKNVFLSSKRFSYSHNRSVFLKYICGGTVE